MYDHSEAVKLVHTYCHAGSQYHFAYNEQFHDWTV